MVKIATFAKPQNVRSFKGQKRQKGQKKKLIRLGRKDSGAEKIALMVAESCGRGGAERSEAQHPATLGADSKTGAEACSFDALFLNSVPRLGEAADWMNNAYVPSIPNCRIE